MNAISTLPDLPAVPLPAFDPLGLPTHPVLILGLAYLTLTLHFLAMQFTVGSALLLVWTKLRGRAADAPAGQFLGGGIPLGFSYLVTLGIPPLLFVQVLYGQFFYSSSILVGAFWIFVIPIIILGYGAAYAHKFSRARRPRPQAVLAVVIALSVLAVGYIYVHNLTLSLTPAAWLAKYVANPGGGTLNHGEPTLFPRFALFVGPGFLVAAIALLVRGAVLRAWGRRDLAEAAAPVTRGALVAGVVLFLGGLFGLILTLPPAVRNVVTADGLSLGLLGVAAFGALGAAAVGVMGAARDGLRWALLSGGAYVAGLAALVILRDRIRFAYLSPYLDLRTLTVNDQWGMVSIFAGSLVVGLALVVFLTVKVGAGMLARRRAELVSTP